MAKPKPIPLADVVARLGGKHGCSQAEAKHMLASVQSAVRDGSRDRRQGGAPAGTGNLHRRGYSGTASAQSRHRGNADRCRDAAGAGHGCGTVQDGREGGNRPMSEGATIPPHKQNGGAPERPAPLEPLPSGQGTIRYYLAEKGLGFIARNGELDLFFHVTDLVDGNLAVEISQKVCFDLEPSQRKPGTFVAVRVQRYGFEKSKVEEG